MIPGVAVGSDIYLRIKYYGMHHIIVILTLQLCFCNTMSERWWLKRDSGTNSVRMFFEPNEGGAEDKGLVELLMPGAKGGEINVLNTKHIVFSSCFPFCPINFIGDGRRDRMCYCEG